MVIMGQLLMSSFPVAADEIFLTDLVGGLTFQAAMPDTQELDPPGTALRTDFGSHLGYGFWFLITLAWSSMDGQPLDEQCGIRCVKDADTLMAGVMLRYTLPFEDLEMYVQMGPGYLVDLLELHEVANDVVPWSFNEQAVFLLSTGLGVRVYENFYLGVRTDVLLGSERDELNLGLWAGYRFHFAD
jgi:hypothetical protein